MVTRTVTLVCGPPCAGKTTYVRAHAQPGDLILDADTIGERAMRRQLARVAAMTSGTAWVIRCSPGPHHRDALARQIRATNTVLLLPPEAELIARAKHRPSPRRHIQAVRKWLTMEAGAGRGDPKAAAEDTMVIHMTHSDVRFGLYGGVGTPRSTCPPPPRCPVRMDHDDSR